MGVVEYRWWIFTLWIPGITYSADCLAYCVMTHLLWPTRSEQYFLLAEDADLSDELDEFNEAPHVVNNYIALNSHHHHHLHNHHSVNSEPPDLTKVITWIFSCVMTLSCHIFLLNSLLKNRESRRVYCVMCLYIHICYTAVRIHCSFDIW